MAERIRIDGDEQIARGIRNTIRDLENSDEVSADVAERLRTEAQRGAPKRTGRLASSGRIARSGSAVVVSFGNSGVRYAAPINFGVGPRVGMRGPHNIRASRFFTNAVRNTEQILPDEHAIAIQRSLDRITGA